jgi:hypothetical protein
MKTRIVIAALLALLLPAVALAGNATSDRKHRGILYWYVGELAAAPTSNSLTVNIEGGNRPALKTLIGQSAQQTFTYSERTQFLLWQNGIPTVVDPSALQAGHWVRVNVRAHRGASISEIVQKAPGIVGDHVTEPQRPDKPLFLFRGKLTAVGSSSVTVDVTGGNRRALHLMIGQPASQTFAFDSNTIVLHWQGKVPTVIGASQLEVGERIVVRVRADKGSTLAQVEATPAKRLAEREPAEKSKE